jgi:hypothetical protein
LSNLVSAVLSWCSLGVDPWRRKEPRHAINHGDIPAIVMHDVVVMAAQQAQVAQSGIAAVGPVFAVMGVAP